MKIYSAIKVAVPALMLALASTSCKEEANAANKIKDGATTASVNTPEEDAQAQQAAVANEAAAANAANAQPQVVQQQFNVPAPQATAPGMNPPHGQPGHRCEIAVGAPLNSAPAKPQSAAPQPVAQAPQPVEFAPPAAKDAGANVVTPPGMNPPHGQPGHTCSVAVGAPLPK